MIGPKNESYSSAVARSRYSTSGLIWFRMIDILDPARLKAFDTELLAKCSVWLAGDMSSKDIADVVTFFLDYNIQISDMQDICLDFSRDDKFTVGFRVNNAINASLLVESPSRNFSLAAVFWNTLLDVLCYRGLDARSVR